jgi:hypothetical protein
MPRLITRMMRPDLHPAAAPFDSACLCRPQARRAAGSHPMAYFANFGPRSGPILGRHRLVAVAVLQAPDERTPIGMALALGREDDEAEVWELTVQGVELPGRWIVGDREFHPVR